MGRSRIAKVVSMVAVAGLATAVLAAGPGAAGADEQERGNVNGSLELGQLASQTGELSDIVQSLTVPVTMAVSDINAAGGVLGKPVTYTVADDANDPEVASESLEGLLEDAKVDAIMGPTSSGIALNILDEVRRRGVLMCSGSNTSAELSTTDSDGYYFRTTPSDRLQGPALADLVLKDGRKKVGILARRDTYGVGLERSVTKALEKGKAKVVADVSYDPDAKNFDKDVQRVVAKKPDAVIVLGFENDGSHIVRTLTAKGLSPQQFPIYSADGMRTNAFPTLLDPNNAAAAAGIKGTSPATQPAGVQSAFFDAFSATGIDPIYSSNYYDCTVLTALAAEKAKSDDPAKMKEVFAANTRGKEPCRTFADCKQLLDDGKTIHYEGASAAFKHMNRFGKSEPNAGVYEVWQFDENGRDVTAPPETQIRIG
ncbi:MAG TPA: ABC transporter substrate-binding protein [Acidimicrobiia bacterium]|nr:ABC transporter substrate-binding protein [Acidimicrobiia bacterium]